MAEYNQWMNESIYRTAANLSLEELQQDKSAFFSSIMGTLNHVLIADIIRLKRFAMHPADFNSLASLKSKALPAKLDTILFSELEPLQQERALVDKVIIEFAAQLCEASLASHLPYFDTRGMSYCKKSRELTAALF